jgi:hypothetical protein
MRNRSIQFWKMKRFAIEHLPRAVAVYQVTPVTFTEAQEWLGAAEVISLVRTTELIGAIRDGLGATLEQSDAAMALAPGDEALLISLSFSVLLAWAKGNIVPLEDDWRCALLKVEKGRSVSPPFAAAASQELATDVAE